VDIANFLAGFAAESGSDRVHVIAHSMGNRGLLRAISRIVNDASKLSRCRFTHLVLAAPDVDTKVFQDLAANFAKVAKRATLYVSDKDVLLEASSWLHDYPRAGICPPVTVVPRVDTIDVGKVDLSLLGHGYVGAARVVLTDMYNLLHEDATPEKRMGLMRLVDSEGAEYWTFRA
jgi:esterase/lipase superfamily enzyme